MLVELTSAVSPNGKLIGTISQENAISSNLAISEDGVCRIHEMLLPLEKFNTVLGNELTFVRI